MLYRSTDVAFLNAEGYEEDGVDEGAPPPSRAPPPATVASEPRGGVHGRPITGLLAAFPAVRCRAPPLRSP